MGGGKGNAGRRKTNRCYYILRAPRKTLPAPRAVWGTAPVRRKFYKCAGGGDEADLRAGALQSAPGFAIIPLMRL